MEEIYEFGVRRLFFYEYGIQRPAPLTGVLTDIRNEEEARRTLEHLKNVSDHKGWKIVRRKHIVDGWEEAPSPS
jgi:hypothetical protein